MRGMRYEGVDCIAQDQFITSVCGIFPPSIDCINTVLGIAVREESSKKGVTSIMI